MFLGGMNMSVGQTGPMMLLTCHVGVNIGCYSNDWVI